MGGQEVEEWRDQPVRWMRRELGFHSVQSDRRQLLYGLPSNAPSSTNQIARCAFVSPTPPFSPPFCAALWKQLLPVQLTGNGFGRRRNLKKLHELDW